MADFEKILSHKDRDKIIGRLVDGELPKDIAQSLKIQYPDKDQANLRLSASLLQEFIDKYFNQYQFLNKIVLDEKTGKHDKIVYESLLNNKSWKDRVAKLADNEIDLKKQIQNLVTIVQDRMEQVFDKIQENPNGTKVDYVFIKYIDAIDKLYHSVNKIVNERPDQVIQHDISVTMVEQHSVAFQEAIRETLLELSPEVSALFMDKLTNKLNGMQPDTVSLPKPKSVETRRKEIINLLPEAVFDEEEDYTFEPLENNGEHVS